MAYFPYLLCNELEVLLRVHALIGLPQNGIERLSSRTMKVRGVGGDSKCCNLHLHREKGSCDRSYDCLQGRGASSGG